MDAGAFQLRPAEPEDAIQAQARAWLLRLSENPEAEADCVAWRAADPAHERVWQEVSSVWNRAAELSMLKRQDWRAEIDMHGKAAWRRYAPWSLSAAAAAAVAAFLLTPSYRDKPQLSASTKIAEIRDIALIDGSKVTLGARSQMEVRFEPSSRRVILDKGQAFFEVAHDSGRPFTVVAGDAEIRVTGTKFDVRRMGDDIEVSVLEGRVELRRRGILSILTPKEPQRVLTAGLKAEFTHDSDSFSPEQKSGTPAGEWRTGRLFYNEAPLSEIVADIQRYSPVAIRIDDPAIAGLRVTTSFRSDQVDAFLANLSATMPVISHRAADGAIVLRTSDSGV